MTRDSRDFYNFDEDPDDPKWWKNLAGIPVLQPPSPDPLQCQPAQQLYQAGLQACTERGIPFDRIRLVWWEMEGSDKGLAFDPIGWRTASYQDERKIHQIPVSHRPYDPLPLASTLWLRLSPDEAIMAGYGEHIDQSRNDFPEFVKITLFVESLFGAHVLRLEGLPAEQAPRDMTPKQRRANNERVPIATIRCLRCSFNLSCGPDTLDWLMRQLEGTRDTETQVRLAEIYLRNMHPDRIPSESNAAYEVIRKLLNSPLRETHPLACKANEFQARKPYTK